MKNIGNYIKEKRLETGISARELARRSEVSQPYLSQLENGKTNNPTVEILNKLAKGLGIPNGDLLMMAGYIGDPFEHENIKKTTDTDLSYILDIKEEAYYNGKLLTPEQRKKAKAVLDILFIDQTSN